MKLLLCLAFLLLPVAATAKPAKVRSGEHSDFSRLVIYLPDGADWVLSRGQKTATFTVSDWREGFGIETVFSKIPRTRIRNISASNESLTLQLGCECSVSAEALPNGPVVLDIRDEAKRVENPVALLPAPKTIKVVTERAPVILAPEERKILSQFRTSLLREIGTAASHSLLTLDDHNSTSARIPAQDQFSLDPPKPNPTETTKVRVQSDQIRTRSAAKDAEFSPHTHTYNPAKLVCIPEGDLDAASWGQDTELGRLLGTARSELFGEFDRVDARAAQKLAKTYLYYSLPEEAVLILRQFARENDKKERVLYAVSDVIIGRSTTRSFGNLSHCGPRAQLWSILSGTEIPNDELTVDPILMAFKELPLEMRKVLGPTLMIKLRDAGLDTAAKVVQADITRSAPEARLVLELAAYGRDANADAQELTSAVARNDESSPAALAALINHELASEDAFDGELIALAEASLKVQMESPAQQDLLLAMIAAQARVGQVTLAFENLKSSRIPTEAKNATEQAILAEVLGRGVAREIALSAIHFIDRDRLGGLTEANLGDLIERLLDAGLPDLAERARVKISDVPLPEKLLARIALDRREPKEISAFAKDSTIPGPLRARLAFLSNQEDFLLAGDFLSPSTRSDLLWKSRRFAAQPGDSLRAQATALLKTNENDEPAVASLISARAR